MKRTAALFCAGVLALVLQGALSTWLPAALSPDLGLLSVLALGLVVRSAAVGFGLAAALGYCADALSGSLLGQHAFLRLLVFAAARLGSRQLNLRGSLPLAVFAAGLTLAYGGALRLLGDFFASAAGVDVGWSLRLLLHAGVSAITAPLMVGAFEEIASRVGEDEAARRSLRFEHGGRPA